MPMLKPYGLSPRVRGEPQSTIAKPLLLKVYPRVCGGTGMERRIPART